jgi:hypothetical protein
MSLAAPTSGPRLSPPAESMHPFTNLAKLRTVGSSTFSVSSVRQHPRTHTLRRKWAHWDSNQGPTGSGRLSYSVMAGRNPDADQLVNVRTLCLDFDNSLLLVTGAHAGFLLLHNLPYSSGSIPGGAPRIRSIAICDAATLPQARALGWSRSSRAKRVLPIVVLIISKTAKAVSPQSST